MLQGKTIIVTGAASGIGAASAALAASYGANVISVDINEPAHSAGEFFQADLSDKGSIDKLLAALPAGVNGLANIAGLPPTRPAESVVAVNLVGLKYLTTKLVPKLADGASIVNLASLAGLGWADAKEAIDASANLEFGDVAAFCKAHEIIGPRSYFFSKEALIVWTMQKPVDMALAGHSYECGQSRSRRHPDPKRLHRNARCARRGGHAHDGPRRHTSRHRSGGCISAV